MLLPSSQQKYQTKRMEEENFPVASIIVPKKLRPAIIAFYDFARVADDIADNPRCRPLSKIKALNHLDKALDGAKDTSPGQVCHRLRQYCLDHGITLNHARNLLVAFRQDAKKNRYANWNELVDYCRHSAAPVGRFVLDLHNQPKTSWVAADNLCIALQILNHLQDCRQDYIHLRRVYMPEDWIGRYRARLTDLKGTSSSNAWRLVFDHVLNQTTILAQRANVLPSHLNHRRLACETATITHIAWQLIKKLRHQDPLTKHIRLSWHHNLRALLLGIRDGICLSPVSCRA